MFLGEGALLEREMKGQLEPRATGQIQQVGEWQVGRRARQFWEERGFKETVAKVYMTWVRETGEDSLEGVLLCVNICSGDFNLDLKSP